MSKQTIADARLRGLSGGVSMPREGEGGGEHVSPPPSYETSGTRRLC
jgi:hypothetical protein